MAHQEGRGWGWGGQSLLWIPWSVYRGRALCRQDAQREESRRGAKVAWCAPLYLPRLVGEGEDEARVTGGGRVP